VTTSTTASQNLSSCKVDGCHAPVFSTKLCTKHKKQEQRQRQAFVKTRREWREEFFVPDLKIKKGRNPRPSMVPLEVAAHLFDSDGNRLPIKAKKKHVSRDGETSDSAADVRTAKKWEANWRKNGTREFKTVHYAERDRAVWLRGQGEPAPKLPAQCISRRSRRRSIRPAGASRHPATSWALMALTASIACSRGASLSPAR
jgi:hypothetical protein